ncbi:site-specific integrase [Ottowia thiooxydans]|uniref:site-specific integrase n=1 Tax=Ottowia thiooxydans TaxID=219182 RepID=UPI0004033FAB|nr:site-specific integrase [Ottowia thiooxydans]
MPVVTFSAALLATGLVCPPDKKRIEYCDKDCPGLLAEVRQGGGSVPTWYVRYKQPTTKYKRLGDLRSMTLAQARKAALMFKSQLSNTPKVIEVPAQAKGEVTLDAFVKEHVNPYNQMRKRSHVRDLQFYTRVGAKFGQSKLSEINRREVQVFHNELVTKERLAPATADHHVVYMRRLLNLAVQWEMLEKNTLTRIPLMKVDNQVERYLTDEEVQRLVPVLTTDLAYGASYILLFLLSTGARLNEAMQAKWEQIDLQTGVWRIPAKNSKSKKGRAVPLNASALWVLGQLWTKDKNPHLFVNEATNKPFVTITRAWYRLRAKAGIEGLRIHDLRHSFASFLVNGGRSLYEVQQILGHSDPKVTMRYAHLSTKALQEAANAASVIVKQQAA